jgi:transmembrane 9 superfamily protein 2/4
MPGCCDGLQIPDVCLGLQLVPMAMYFGYMFIVSYSFFCLTGTIGFYACYIFVRKIYSAVKID